MKGFWRDETGNMAMLFAVAFSMFGVIGAISIDTATLYHERRMLQSTVDLAAITATAAPSEARTLVERVFTEAGYDITPDLVVDVGRFTADPAATPENRFVINATPANAVRVSYRTQGTLHFGRTFTSSPTLGAQGLAMVTPEVSFSVGSRFASLNGGVANALLGTLLGTTVSLSALDYTGLASARVDVLTFLDALAQRLHISAGSYNDLLAAQPRAGDIAAALASVVSGAERAALTTLAMAGQGNVVPLKKLLSIERYGRLAIGSGGSALDVDLSVLEILSAAAAVADGSKQVSLGLGGSMPGIAALTVELVVGEPPQGGGWFAVGSVGSIVRTAQVRLRIDAQFLGGVVLQNALVRLPLWLDLAHAEATITGATCPDTGHPHGTADIAVIPGPLTLAVGQVTNTQLRNFGAPLPVASARILDAALLKIAAAGQVNVAQTSAIPVHFSSSDIGQAKLKSAKTTTVVSSLTQSLLNTLTLDVSVLGIGLQPVNVIANALKTLLSPLVSPLDSVVNTLLTSLGLGVGEADVRVYGVRCTTPVLVG